MVYIRIHVVVRRHKNQIQVLQVQELLAQTGEMANFANHIKSTVGAFYVYLTLIFSFLFTILYVLGCPGNLRLDYRFEEIFTFLKHSLVSEFVFEPCNLLLEDETHSYYGHTAKHPVPQKSPVKLIVKPVTYGLHAVPQFKTQI